MSNNDPKIPDELAAIDPAMLEAVTGGAGGSDQIAMMLQSLLSSIQDLAASRQQNSGGDFMQMLPIMMMMMNRSAPQPAVAQAPAPQGPQTISPGDGWVRVA